MAALVGTVWACSVTHRLWFQNTKNAHPQGPKTGLYKPVGDFYGELQPSFIYRFWSTHHTHPLVGSTVHRVTEKGSKWTQTQVTSPQHNQLSYSGTSHGVLLTIYTKYNYFNCKQTTKITIICPVLWNHTLKVIWICLLCNTIVVPSYFTYF